MGGITFLAEETFTYIPEWLILTLLIVSIVSFISIIIGAKFLCLDDHPIVGLILSIVFVLCFIMSLTFNNINLINNEQTQYKVTIDDTVTFKEFSEKYKVVSQEGEIYTIVEIEEGE